MRALALLGGLFCLYLGPAAVCGAETVPPGNSAAAQYTETYPTSQGNEQGGSGGSHRSPARTLGSRNAGRLEALGPQGRAAAALAAATAPSPAQPGAGAGPAGGRGGGAPAGRSTPAERLSEPGGSSAIGDALGQAVGVSAGGGTGLVLPAALLAVLAWAAAYAWRRRPSG
ncbi:MAG TPA: hypothetical protein VFL77_08510 [Solirubrobacterales bacterium]|nr:hypothetical protein [Solirubrobacterales bacterium]